MNEVEVCRHVTNAGRGRASPIDDGQIMIKRMVFVILFIGLGFVFFLQKQHEKRAALEAKRRTEAAKPVSHAVASDMTSAQNTEEARKPPGSPTPKPRATSMLPKPTPMLPKPTPMLPKATPVLGRTP